MLNLFKPLIVLAENSYKCLKIKDCGSNGFWLWQVLWPDFAIGCLLVVMMAPVPFGLYGIIPPYGVWPWAIL
jgi:hypothetical protein